MEPAFKQISQKYTGQVEVLKINADDSPEVIKFLGIMGIPTILVFSQGKELLRRTGLQSEEALDILFDAALHGHKPAILPPAPIDRLLRTIAGLAMIGLAWFNNQSILFYALGAVLLFSAFYDRCPIYKAVAPRIKNFFSR
jgi:thioredoxin 1